jgi:hypothetical protein
MALVCTQCGTDNPAGNTFCLNCGSSLAAAPPPPGFTPETPAAVAQEPPVAVAPGTALPPLSFLPPGYVPPGSFGEESGPYLPAPPSGTPPAHRTSSTMLIAIVVVVLLVVGGGGVAYAALHKGGSTPAPNPNIPVSAPTSAPTTAPPQPPGAPAQSATSGAGGQTVTTPFAKVLVPTGYTVSDQGSDYIVLTPNDGNEEAIGAQAEPLTGTTTNAELDQDLLTGDQQNGDPSAKMCSTKAPSQTQLAGSGGAITADVISICESVTPINGPAFSAVDAYVAGVAKAADGTFKAVWFEILAPVSSFQAFTAGIPSALFAQTVFSDAAPPA